MGIQRGKNDVIDAQRICQYGFRYQDKAVNYKVKTETIQKIQLLLSSRSRLMTAKSSLMMPINELKRVGLKEEAKIVETACKTAIEGLEKDIKSLTKELESLGKKEESISENYKLITSVRSVGPITALYLIVYTNNFQRFESAKQLASYCGVAPFGYSSGTSVKGKTQVNHMSNKILKKVLHMCALSALSNNKEMKEYAEKKEKEGKNKMLIINNIRNKILHRIFACVRDKKIYVA